MIPMLRALAGSGATIVETVTLSGTYGAPNLSTDTVDDPSNAESGWRFKVNGNIEKLIGVTDTWQGFNSATEWCNVYPGQTYYIRMKLQSAEDTPTSGPVLNTWYDLNTEREWKMLQSTVGIKQGVFLVEIDTVGDGTNIIASGYYNLYSEVGSG